eukprot:56382-Amphidinium_carterae.1
MATSGCANSDVGDGQSSREERDHYPNNQKRYKTRPFGTSRSENTTKQGLLTLQGPKIPQNKAF